MRSSAPHRVLCATVCTVTRRGGAAEAGPGHGVRACRSVAALVAAPLVALGAAPAHAAGGAYVALGDSYSSGTGTGAYLHDGTTCRRSVYAYPSLVASGKGYSLNLRA